MNQPEVAQIGTCQLCRMKGLVAPKSYIGETREHSIVGTYDDTAPTLQLCATCWETPSGCRSENLSHQRLPDVEYARKD